MVIIQLLSKSLDCPPKLGGVSRPLEGWLNANPCRVREAQCSVRRRTRKGAQRRGYYPRQLYHLPLFEGKGLRHSSGKLKFPSSLPTLISRRPPILGGEFKVLDNSYIIALLIQSKPPKRKDIARRELDIVFYDISLFNTLYLTQSLRTATDLKNNLSDTEVSDRRGYNRIVHSHLVKEECLSHIPFFCTRKVQKQRKFALTKCKFILPKEIFLKNIFIAVVLDIAIFQNEKQENPPSEYVCVDSPKGDSRI